MLTRSSNGLPSDEEIQTHLTHILSSEAFKKSPRSRELLRFVIDETLSGNAKSLSQRTIAQHVYARDKLFDPSYDPIVRVQATRVRQQLEHYYLTVGSTDSITITLPKGSYVPEFSIQNPGPLSPNWPTILIQPFINLSDHPEAERVALGLSSELAAEFNLYTNIEVFMPAVPVTDNTDCPTRFLIEGTVKRIEQQLQINIHLVDRETRHQIWAHRHRCSSVNHCAEEKQQMVQWIAASIAEEQGEVNRWMAKEIPANAGATSGAYEAILLYHRFEHAPSATTYLAALSGLQNVITLAPDCGTCMSYLARLMVNAWAFGPCEESVTKESIIKIARKGLQKNPQDLRSRITLAYIYLLTDHLEECRTEAEAALSTTRNGYGIWLDAIGYLLTLCGDWERGPQLIHQSLTLTPRPIDASHAALWLNALYRNNMDELLKEAFLFERSGVFWEPLLRAVPLALMGRIAEAEHEVQRIVACCPDFPVRGIWYIERFIKFPLLVDRITDTLALAGLNLRRTKCC